METNTPQRSAFAISAPQLTMLVVCLVSVYFIIAFYGKSLESYRINLRAAAVRQQIVRLEARNQQLQEKAADLSTDGYLETTARDKLNLIKPGDRSLVALQAEQPIASVAGPPPTNDANRFTEFGHLGDWLVLFFGSR